MRKIAAALVLSGFALSASAFDFARDTVTNPQACPVGTDASANFKWQNGHLVRDGWVCVVNSAD